MVDGEVTEQFLDRRELRLRVREVLKPRGQQDGLQQGVFLTMNTFSGVRNLVFPLAVKRPLTATNLR